MSDKIRFIIVGIINAIFAYFLYAVSLIILKENSHQLSLAIAWILSSFTSFYAHRIFVFRGKGNIVREYLKCCSTWVIAYLINAILLEVFVVYMNINPFLAQVLAPAIAGIFTYFMFKKKCFKRS